MPAEVEALPGDRALTTDTINTLRFLAVDAVERAKSGHPGMPMGAAPMAYVLWHNFLQVDPSAIDWPDRDRFVLSAGHGSMLLYGLLHLSGFPLSLEDIRAFRQWKSQTPGHPENFITRGIETTTGPLGQGFANGVGMAIAEAHLAARFNRTGYPVVDHYTYGIVSDGDLMEGISHEAASLAGHLGLGKLIYLYDDNEITIDGSTDLALSDDATLRFESYGWQVLSVQDGTDVEALDEAIRTARLDTDRPTLIRVRTVIGHGSPNKGGTADAHGAPLGADEIRLTKEKLGWPQEPTFHVPSSVREHMGGIAARGARARREWEGLMQEYRGEYPELALEFEHTLSGALPQDLAALLPDFGADDGMATRAASGRTLAALSDAMPYLVGGSADLSGSNNTVIKNRTAFSRQTPEGNYFYFGVREHAMASICNGLSLHGGLIPYCGTFLIFSDYLRPALRLSALMGRQVIFVLTHDSIGLGEDGPTHQPVEHYMALRAIPNATFIRPADPRETAAAWEVALRNRKGPTMLALTRQKVPVIDLPMDTIRAGVDCGAYVVSDPQGPVQAVIIATGSEVGIAREAADQLRAEGIGARVVSMPSWERFDQQDRSYRDSVLPPSVRTRVSVEAGITMGWERYVGDVGGSVGLDRFGASAPAEVLFEKFGLTAEAVAEKVKQCKPK